MGDSDVEGAVQDYEKENVNFDNIQEVNRLRKCHHVCLLIQYKMGWFGKRLVQ